MSNVLTICNLVPGCQAEITSALETLANQLRQYYFLTSPPVESLIIEDPASLWNHVTRNLPGQVVDEKDQDHRSYGRRLFIFCAENHSFVRRARIQNPRAHWGIAVPGQFAVAWVENAYLWWHEALHLFNAKDCYNKFGINKCPEPRCVMQASPTAQTCGHRLYLCSKNQHRLKQAFLEDTFK